MSEFEGAYTREEVELNNRLLEECSKEILDCNAIEELLKKGADPLGSTEDLDIVLSEIISESQCDDSVNLPKIIELFLKYGMNISKPKVLYDNDERTNPMWYFTFVPNENAAIALKMLLDNDLDSDSAGMFWTHSIRDEIDVYPNDPNDADGNNWIVWTMKMIMLLASYDHILNEDEQLRDFIGLTYNDFDVHAFRDWNNFEYKFDTSRCEETPQLYRSVINIYEKATGKKVWKIGVYLEEGEF